MRLSSQFFLDAQQLIVFCNTIAPAGSSAFDLSGIQRNCQIRNRGILRFAGTVRDDSRVTGTVCHGDSIQRFRQRADLIDFDKNGIRDAPFDSLLKPLSIGDE